MDKRESANINLSTLHNRVQIMQTSASRTYQLINSILKHS